MSGQDFEKSISSDDAIRMLEEEKNTLLKEKEDIEKELESMEIDVDVPDIIERYEDMLRDVYGQEIDICGLKYDPAYALKNLDEIAYNMGLNDYVDSLDVAETEEYREKDERVSEIEDRIEEIEEEIEEYKKETEEEK